MDLSVRKANFQDAHEETGRSLWSLIVGFRSTTSCCTARSATGMIGSVGEWARVERRPTTIISSVSEGWFFRLFFSTYVLILPNAATPVWSIDEPINRLVSSAYFDLWCFGWRSDATISNEGGPTTEPWMFDSHFGDDVSQPGGMATRFKVANHPVIYAIR